MIEIDGSKGEGGGQILRSALSLSICTQQPFRIRNIRARREKPGLMRQHLTAVRAAAEISSAEVIGDEVGSTALEFKPGTIKPGDYSFSIGTAGSCTLVFQTVLSPLLLAESASRISITGGTHNKGSPPVDFLQRAFLPLISRMGADVSLELKRHGFFPRGGGEIVVDINPVKKLQALHLHERGERKFSFAEAYITGIPIHVAERELSAVGKALNWEAEQLKLRGLSSEVGPGNAITITLEHQYLTEVFTGFAERGVSAEAVAYQAIDECRDYLTHSACAGPHLADQLLLPMALAGAGSFTTCKPTLHFESNCETISKFLGVSITRKEVDNNCVVEIR